MCGIVGVLGGPRGAPILVEALKRLEYRGYDSAGIATVNNGVLDRRRAVGKLVNLSDLLVTIRCRARPGSGTPAGPPMAPHGQETPTPTAPAGRVVHNGIIENYRALRANWLGPRVRKRPTDTETIAICAEAYLDEGMTPRRAPPRRSKHWRAPSRWRSCSTARRT
jgi:glucosamine--fructose-6-phosphate aminotransferase (isomerizing)